jgi:hypothetical protein
MSESTKTQLRSLRCANHSNREAAARCQECKRHFCRECITSYKDKMLCKSCLDGKNNDAVKKKESKHIIATILLLLIFSGSFFLNWLFFLWFGKILASIPDKFQNVEAFLGGG